MTAKAGQKCTAIRRAIMPRAQFDAVAARLRERLSKVVVGDPALEGVRMGALASHAQQADVAERVATLLQSGAEVLFGARRFRAAWRRRVRRRVLRADAARLRAPVRYRRGARDRGVRPGRHADAVRRHRRGARARRARQRQPRRDARDARPGGRGPRRAGRRGAARAAPDPRPRRRRRVDRPRHAAAGAEARRPGPRRRRRGIGRPARGAPLPAALRGAGVADDARRRHRRACARRARERHAGAPVPQPFRRREDRRLAADAPPHRDRGRHRRVRRHLGRLLLHALRRDRRRRVAVRQAHRTRLLRAVGGGRAFRLAGARAGAREHGLDTLRFVKPVGIGDTIRARLTAKRKIDRNKTDAQGVGQGVAAWDVEVTNQHGEMVASYDILTLVAKRAVLA